MSFAFMPLYTGDYQRDTQHLTPEENGIFLKLLMHCWDQKGPAPIDERKLCGIVNARSGGEIESLRRILGEFFIRCDDGWYNKRMTSEVARAEHISANNRAAGIKSSEKRQEIRSLKHATRVERTLNARSTVAGTLTPTLTTTTTTTTTKVKRSVRNTAWESPPH